MKAIEVDVFGLVQGVGFRWFAQRTPACSSPESG